LESDDKKLWGAYVKSVKRVKRQPTVPKTKLANKSSPQPRIEVPKQSLNIALKPAPPNKPSPLLRNKITFDKKTERQLRQGNIFIDARLDLHGMTQAEAYAALDGFVTAQAKVGRRNLLVITGKGRSSEGVLHVNFPGWLETLSAASSVISYRAAATKHGGSGAFYVILKRQKE